MQDSTEAKELDYNGLTEHTEGLPADAYFDPRQHERELQRGNRNRATLAVARKLVAYLLAVDKSGKPFEIRQPPTTNSEEQKVA